MDWPDFRPEAARYFTSLEACSCPDWHYRGRQRPCKHVRELRQALAVLDSHKRKWDGIRICKCQHSENLVK